MSLIHIGVCEHLVGDSVPRSVALFAGTLYFEACARGHLGSITDGDDEPYHASAIDLLRRKEACSIAFDLLWINDDLRLPPLVERKKRLKRPAALQSPHR